MYYLRSTTLVGGRALIEDFVETRNDGIGTRYVTRSGDRWWYHAYRRHHWLAVPAEARIPLDKVDPACFITADEFESVWQHALRSARHPVRRARLGGRPRPAAGGAASRHLSSRDMLGSSGTT